MARRNEIEELKIDFTSMIDICFLLISFFIMVTEVAREEVIEVFLPTADNAIPDENPPDGRIIVNVDRRGVVWIKGEKLGEPADDAAKDLILKRLRAYAEDRGFEQDKPGRPSRLVTFVRADAHCAYGHVQGLMMLMTDPKVRITKVHYVAKNPYK